MKLVVCDASPLIFLAELDRLNLISKVLDGDVFVLQCVVDEVASENSNPLETARLRVFFEHVEVIDFRRPLSEAHCRVGCNLRIAKNYPGSALSQRTENPSVSGVGSRQRRNWVQRHAGGSSRLRSLSFPLRLRLRRDKSARQAGRIATTERSSYRDLDSPSNYPAFGRLCQLGFAFLKPNSLRASGAVPNRSVLGKNP